MKATLRLSAPATYAEYLAIASATEHRLEFIDGVIVAMAGGSHVHNALGGRFAMLFGARVRPPCRTFSPDQRFWIAATARGRFSDGAIICGTPSAPPHDRHAATNPTVVLEVLSPSSIGDDEGDKRSDFQSLETLQAYLLAAQDARAIRVYRRDDRGAWRQLPDHYRDGDELLLPGMTAPITVAEIYDGILDEHGRSVL
jgi:Uma2 family endonuclease